MKYLFRILGLPFFSALTLIFFIRLWLIHSFNFLKYGGEAISYTEDNNAKTIAGVYSEIKKMNRVNEVEAVR